MAEEEVEVVGAPIERSAAELRIEKIRRIEDELLSENMAIMRDVAKFREIEPGATAPPEIWLDEFGAEEAWRRFRVAQAGWMSAKEAPVAIAVAKSVTLGIIKARSAEKAGNRTLNVSFIQMPAPTVQFKTLEIEDGKR